MDKLSPQSAAGSAAQAPRPIWFPQFPSPSSKGFPELPGEVLAGDL